MASGTLPEAIYVTVDGDEYFRVDDLTALPPPPPYAKVFQVTMDAMGDYSVVFGESTKVDIPARNASPWSVVTTYAAGDTVLYDNVGWVSLQNGNLAHTPTGNATDTWWRKIQIIIQSADRVPLIGRRIVVQVDIGAGLETWTRVSSLEGTVLDAHVYVLSGDTEGRVSLLLNKLAGVTAYTLRVVWTGYDSNLRFYMKILAKYMDEMLYSIRNYPGIRALETAADRFLNEIANEFGFPLVYFMPEADKRWLLGNLVEFYRLKGALPSLQMVKYLLAYATVVDELWSCDYQTFIKYTDIPSTHGPMWGIPWDAGVTYALGRVVRSDSKTWESLQNGNLNHDPAASPAWWKEIQQTVLGLEVAFYATDAWTMDPSILSSTVGNTLRIYLPHDPSAISMNPDDYKEYPLMVGSVRLVNNGEVRAFSTHRRTTDKDGEGRGIRSGVGDFVAIAADGTQAIVGYVYFTEGYIHISDVAAFNAFLANGTVKFYYSWHHQTNDYFPTPHVSIKFTNTDPSITGDTLVQRQTAFERVLELLRPAHIVFDLFSVVDTIIENADEPEENLGLGYGLDENAFEVSVNRIPFNRGEWSQEQPQWGVGATYATGDWVTYQLVHYQSIQDGNIGNTPDVSPLWWTAALPAEGPEYDSTRSYEGVAGIAFRTPGRRDGREGITLVGVTGAGGVVDYCLWDAAYDYAVNAIVETQQVYWASLQTPNVNQPPASSPAYWMQISPDTWDSGTTYALNDYACFKDVLYQSLQNGNLNHNPVTSPAWWSPIVAMANRVRILATEPTLVQFLFEKSTLDAATILGLTVLYIWTDGTAYTVGDHVEDLGLEYNCILNHTADAAKRPPNGTYWALIGNPWHTKVISTIDGPYDFSGVSDRTLRVHIVEGNPVTTPHTAKIVTFAPGEYSVREILEHLRLATTGHLINHTRGSNFFLGPTEIVTVGFST